MTSAFHGDPPGQPERGPFAHARVTQRLHPGLTSVIHRLTGTALESSFLDRTVEVSTLGVLGDPIDRAEALVAHRWVLERADGDGLPLTASGYLKPVDVQALAAVMPGMQDWLFKITREIDTHPVLYFREYLKAIGLIRKYKASLRLTKTGRAGLADVDVLWQHLAGTLVPSRSASETEAGIVVLVHMATTQGRLDLGAIAKTLALLGWSHRDGTPVDDRDVYPFWNDLWNALGNVGEPEPGDVVDRNLSAAAQVLVHDALFAEVDAGPVG